MSPKHVVMLQGTAKNDVGDPGLCRSYEVSRVGSCPFKLTCQRSSLFFSHTTSNQTTSKTHVHFTIDPFHQPITHKYTTVNMRGNAPQVKVHYKGNDDDYIIFVDSAQAVQDWKKDSSVPLAQVVSGWKIFVTHKYVQTYELPRHTPPRLRHQQARNHRYPRWRFERPARQRVRHPQGGGSCQANPSEG